MIKNQIFDYDLEKFYYKYIYNKIETTFFEELQKIVMNNSTNTTNQQKKIEKLMNAYHLKKKENIISINPFWDDQIRIILLSEYTVFSLNYKNLLSKLSCISQYDELFEELNNLDHIITVNEIFYIYIITYINAISQTGEKIMVKEITFLHLLRDSLLDYFDYKLKKEQIKLYLIYYSKLHKYNEIEFVFDSSSFIKEQKFDQESWESYILYIVKYRLKGEYTKLDIDKRSEFYKKEKEKFIEFFNNKKSIYVDFFHKLSILIHDFFISNKLLIKIKGKLGKHTYSYVQFYNLEIFSNIDFIIQINSKLPMINKPKNWSKKGKHGGYFFNNMSSDNSLVKKLKEGYSSFNYSNFTIDSINLLQQKFYSLNLNYLKYINTDTFRKNHDIKNVDELYNLWSESVELQENFKNKYNKIDFNYVIYQDELLSLKSSKHYKSQTHKVKQIILNEFYKKYKIEENQILDYNNYFNKLKEFAQNLNKYKEHKFLIKICEIFIHQMYTVISRMDFRGRIFPLGRVLHRATGIYKHLNNDAAFTYTYDENSFKYLKIYIITLLFKEIKSGYTLAMYLSLFDKTIQMHEISFVQRDYNLLIQYITDYFLYEKTSFIIKNKLLSIWNIIKDLILKTAVENQGLSVLALLDYFNVKANPLYLSNLLVEIDQSCSGPQIYSLLSLDKEMATLTNLLSEKKEDLYLNFLEKFKIVLHESWKNTLDKNKLFLLNDFDKYFTRKNFSKLIIMPTFYNMGDKGIRSLLNSLDNSFITEEIKRELVKLIRKTLDINYTNTINYQKTLVAITNVLYKNKSNVQLRTLDGSFIIYKYIEMKEKFGKVWSINQNKYLSYRIYLPTDSLDKNKLSMKQITTFPPNFIHSIDGAICRIILSLFHKLYNYILEPLHDSFRIPLIFYSHLQHLIKYIYIYVFLNEYFHKYKIGLKKVIYNSTLINNNTLVSCKTNIKYLEEPRFLYEIEVESENYLDYKSYFDFLLTDKTSPLNVLNYCFLDNLTVNNDDQEEVQLLIKNLQNQNKDKWIDEKSIILKIINNDFMFFF